MASVTPPAPTGGGTSLPVWNYTPTGGLWKEPNGAAKGAPRVTGHPVAVVQ